MKIFLLELEEVRMREFKELLLKGRLPGICCNQEDLIKWKVKINATINHVAEGRYNFKMPVVKLIDGLVSALSLYEMRIKLGGYLLRIFFTCYFDKIIIFNFLVKPYKYEKQMKRKVDKQYEQKIKEADSYCDMVIKNKINLIEYIKI